MKIPENRSLRFSKNHSFYKFSVVGESEKIRARLVTKKGVLLDGVYYMHEALIPLIGTEVKCRLLVEGRKMVFLDPDWKEICVAVNCGEV